MYCCWGVESNRVFFLQFLFWGLWERGVGGVSGEKGSNDETFRDIAMRIEGGEGEIFGGGLWKNKYFILFSEHSSAPISPSRAEKVAKFNLRRQAIPCMPPRRWKPFVGNTR